MWEQVYILQHSWVSGMYKYLFSQNNKKNKKEKEEEKGKEKRRKRNRRERGKWGGGEIWDVKARTISLGYFFPLDRLVVHWILGLEEPYRSLCLTKWVANKEINFKIWFLFTCPFPSLTTRALVLLSRPYIVQCSSHVALSTWMWLVQIELCSCEKHTEFQRLSVKKII